MVPPKDNTVWDHVAPGGTLVIRTPPMKLAPSTTEAVEEYPGEICLPTTAAPANVLQSADQLGNPGSQASRINTGPCSRLPIILIGWVASTLTNVRLKETA